MNVREDRISALSSLHEDLYFVSLDLFKTMGLNLVNESLDETGLILPIINKRNGEGTSITATLESSSIIETNNFSV